MTSSTGNRSPSPLGPMTNTSPWRSIPAEAMEPRRASSFSSNGPAAPPVGCRVVLSSGAGSQSQMQTEAPRTSFVEPANRTKVKDTPSLLPASSAMVNLAPDNTLWDAESPMYGPHGLFSRSFLVDNYNLGEGIAFSGLLHEVTNKPHGYGTRTTRTVRTIPELGLVEVSTVQLSVAQWINGTPSGKGMERRSISVVPMEARETNSALGQCVSLTVTEGLWKEGKPFKCSTTQIIAPPHANDDCAPDVRAHTGVLRTAVVDNRPKTAAPCRPAQHTAALQQLSQQRQLPHRVDPMADMQPSPGHRPETQPKRRRPMTAVSRPQQLPGSTNVPEDIHEAKYGVVSPYRLPVTGGSPMRGRSSSSEGRNYVSIPKVPSHEEDRQRFEKGAEQALPTSGRASNPSVPRTTRSIHSKSSARTSSCTSSSRTAKSKFHRGQSVRVIVKRNEYPGSVAYVGPKHGDMGAKTVVGVILDYPVPHGHEGAVNGVRYFDCAPGCGLLVEPQMVLAAWERKPFT